MADMLDQIAEVLRHERELFGEALIVPAENDITARDQPRSDQTPDPVAQRPPDSSGTPTAPADRAVPTTPSAAGRQKPARVRGRMPAGATGPEEMKLFDTPADDRAPLTREPWGDAPSLESLHDMISGCLKCPLGHTRNKFVFGVGNPHADLMLIGEAPGADEDAQGEPFVGRAGQLLTKILEAIQLRREDVYICNILKCRPPGNRKPLAEEADACLPYLRKQIALIRPKLILCLGLTAAENLLGTTESLSRLRGNVLQFEGIPLLVTYHPAALLRNPSWKRPTWDDVQTARRMLDELKSGREP